MVGRDVGHSLQHKAVMGKQMYYVVRPPGWEAAGVTRLLSLAHWTDEGGCTGLRLYQETAN